MGRRDDEGDDEALDPSEAALEAAEADANLRFGLSLLISIVLAAPSLWDAFEGRRALDAALLHYLLCFAVARVGIGVVGQVYSGYRQGGRAAPDALEGRSPGKRAVPGGMSESR